MRCHKNTSIELADNYLALLIAIISPVEISVEEAFAILDRKVRFPREKEISPQMIYEIAQRINDNTLSYSRLERKYLVNRSKIKKIATFLREVRNENREEISKPFWAAKNIIGGNYR